MECILPWYNCPGWLGIKKKVTDLLFTQVENVVLQGCVPNIGGETLPSPQPAEDVGHAGVG